MNTLYETIKKYGEGNGEKMMWQSVALISEAVEKSMPAEAKDKLVSDVYALMTGGHYDEDYAMRSVAKMYYVDRAGEKHYAPYWTKEQIRPYYEDAKDAIPEYNFWDYFVAFNMIASDTWVLYHEWWPTALAEEFAQKVAESTFAWLHDPDWDGTTKIWDYLHIK